MNASRKDRKLQNVALTRDFHFRYMGLWVFSTIALLVSTNIVLYLAIELHLMNLKDVSASAFARYYQLRGPLITGLIAETILFSIGIALLAAFTAHRAAGPYLRLKQAFQTVREGNLGYRLKFRDYDQLDFLADEFNAMVDSMKGGTSGEASKASGQ